MPQPYKYSKEPVPDGQEASFCTKAAAWHSLTQRFFIVAFLASFATSRGQCISGIQPWTGRQSVPWYGAKCEFGSLTHAQKGFIGRSIVDHQQGAHYIEPDGGSEDPDRATAMILILLICVGTWSAVSAGCSTQVLLVDICRLK